MIGPEKRLAVGAFQLSTKAVDNFVGKVGESAASLRRVSIFAALPQQ
ncbi:hypothetical protein [uncultured Azonexus sp.]|nr:hypothetical protein [uncultured Azonexus sp.]